MFPCNSSSFKTIGINFSHHVNFSTLTLCILNIVVVYIFKGLNDDDSYVDIYLHKLVVIFCFIPILASILSYVLFIFKRQRKLSTIYDMEGNTVRFPKKLPPFLPEKVETQAWTKKYNELKTLQTKKQGKVSNITYHGRWAMVTGASGGIGRAVSIELARYNIPVILVSRDKKKLNELAVMIEECYGVVTKVFSSDFSKNNAVEELMKEIEGEGLQIDILVSNAGIGDTNDIVDTTKIQEMVNINVLACCKLCQLLGITMKKKRSGRICIIASIAGGVPGVPSAAIYAATKAFQISLATSIGMELESYGVGVTCILPGAVYDTKFASASNMRDALVWKVPIGNLNAATVASSIIKGIISGSPELVVGWFNVLCVKYIFLFLPRQIVSTICKIMWNPPPSFFSQYKKKC